jgi:L-aminopeptidase/D-esterase-like protein
MAEQQSTPQDQDPEQVELTEQQVEQVEAIAAEAVRTALAEAARQENMTPAERMREGYANKPAA